LANYGATFLLNLGFRRINRQTQTYHRRLDACLRTKLKLAKWGAVSGQGSELVRRASTSISSSPPVLAHLANAPHLAAYCRLLPCRFVSPSSAAPTALPGPAFLASPGGPPVEPRPGRTSSIGLTPRRRTGLGTDDDAMRTTSLPSSPLLDASGAYASPRALLSRSTLLLRSRTSTWPMREIPQPSKTQAARFLHPR
jgi:hypothetical protein